MSEKHQNTTPASAATSTSVATAPPQPQQQPQPQQYEYGTFQGVAAYYTHPPAQPVVGFPQPAPPPGTTTFPPSYYARGYQSVPGYVIAEGRPLREPRLPCCGIGIGWLLFISGFFFAALPWYVGALILLFGRLDYREKPGLVACLVASILAVIAIVFGVTNGDDFDFW